MAGAAPANADLRERVIWVIDDLVGTGHKYAYLEKRTGIGARKWQNVCHRVQQPSIEMITKLAEHRAEFLTWMITGQAVNAVQVDPSVEGWHEKLTSEEDKAFLAFAEAYAERKRARG